MTRAVITACWPWVVVLVGLVLAAHFLVRLSNARLRLGRLRRLHGDQAGSVQSLSFVLTLPIFIMVMMLIVQVSQLMIGLIVVHYAAYAAARSAVVWIPANLPSPEPSNCISSYEVDPDAPNQVCRCSNPQAPNFGPTAGGVTYSCSRGATKYNKIASAAILACMPISPSRDLGFSAADAGGGRRRSLKAVYASVAPASQSNAAVPGRLDHKLAYAWNNTKVEIRFFHKNEEPPLMTYFLGPDPDGVPPQRTGLAGPDHGDGEIQPGAAAGSGAAAGPLWSAPAAPAGGPDHHRSRQVLQLSVDGLDYHGQRGREIGDSLCLSS